MRIKAKIPGHILRRLKLPEADSKLSCAVSAGPFPQHLIRQALFRARGDMTSGEIKQVKEVDSVKAELPLFVLEEAAPDLYKMAEDDNVEIGPFAVRGWCHVAQARGWQVICLAAGGQQLVPRR